MLKTFIFAAGSLLAAAFITSAPADASTHRSHRTFRGMAAHGFHQGRIHVHARSRIASRTYAGARHRSGRVRLARHAHPHHGLAVAHLGYGRHHRHQAAIRRDTLIQRYVGPASSYERASTPAEPGAQVGGASYYGGGRTASGGHVGSATCAHRWLPFGTRVLVTNLNNLRTAILTVNDRGPFVRGRIVDVSVGAAGLLGMLHSGTARVSVRVVGGPG